MLRLEKRSPLGILDWADYLAGCLCILLFTVFVTTLCCPSGIMVQQFMMGDGRIWGLQSSTALSSSFGF